MSWSFPKLKDVYGNVSGKVKNWWEDIFNADDHEGGKPDNNMHYAMQATGTLDSYLGGQYNPQNIKGYNSGVDADKPVTTDNDVTGLSDAYITAELRQIERNARRELESYKSGGNVAKGPFDFLTAPDDPLKRAGKNTDVVIDGQSSDDTVITVDSNPEDDAKAYFDIKAAIDEIKTAYTNESGAIEEEGKKLLEEAHEMYSSIVKMLNDKYGNIISMLGDEKSAEEQRAAINHQKLLKYLPEQLRSMGLGSLGTSQSAFLKAYNQYNNQLSSAQRDYKKGSMDAQNTLTSGLASALSQYATNKTNIRSYIDNKKDSLRDFYGGRLATLENYAYTDKAREDTHTNNLEVINANKEITDTVNDDALALAKQESIANIALETIGDLSSFESAEELKKYAERFTDPESAEYVGELYAPSVTLAAENALNTLAKTKESEDSRLGAMSTDVEIVRNVGEDHGYEEDDIKIKIGDDTEKITLGGSVIGQDAYYAASKFDPNTFFIYDEQLYYKTDIGKVVTVKNTGGYNKLYRHVMANKK